MGLAFKRKADAPSYWKQVKVKRNVRRFGVISGRLLRQVLSELNYTPTAATLLFWDTLECGASLIGVAVSWTVRFGYFQAPSRRRSRSSSPRW
jgi:hypothetical protein